MYYTSINAPDNILESKKKNDREPLIDTLYWKISCTDKRIWQIKWNNIDLLLCANNTYNGTYLFIIILY